jgi:hypothetical protein
MSGRIAKAAQQSLFHNQTGGAGLATRHRGKTVQRRQNLISEDTRWRSEGRLAAQRYISCKFRFYVPQDLHELNHIGMLEHALDAVGVEIGERVS